MPLVVTPVQQHMHVIIQSASHAAAAVAVQSRFSSRDYIKNQIGGKK